jgi:hypothetical protein
MPEESQYQPNPSPEHNPDNIVQPVVTPSPQQPAQNAAPSQQLPSPLLASHPNVPRLPPLPTHTYGGATHAPHTGHHQRSHQMTEHPKPQSGSMVSLITGLLLAVFAYAIPNIPFITRASSNLPFYIVYSVLTICCLVNLFFVTGPSFRKYDYPNILGLIGLVFNCIVLYSAVSVLVIYTFTGNN